jgi:hypothetical protein
MRKFITVIRMIVPRRMRWAGHEAYMGEQCIQNFGRKIERKDC